MSHLCLGPAASWLVAVTWSSFTIIQWLGQSTSMLCAMCAHAASILDPCCSVFILETLHFMGVWLVGTTISGYTALKYRLGDLGKVQKFVYKSYNTQVGPSLWRAVFIWCKSVFVKYVNLKNDKFTIKIIALRYRTSKNRSKHTVLGSISRALFHNAAG